MSMSPADFSHCSSEGGQNLSWNILVLSVVIQCTGKILLHNNNTGCPFGVGFLTVVICIKKEKKKGK